MPAWALSISTKLVITAILVLAGMIGGWELNDWRNAKARKAALEATIKQMVADNERVNAVAAAYEGVTSELRRMQRLTTREVVRETVRIEYRCPLPESGRVLIDAAIDQANSAGGAGGAVPPNREDHNR